MQKTNKTQAAPVTLSRRRALASAAAAAFTAAASPAHALSVDEASQIKWDQTADVVVLGYGNAGTNAAIAAHDAGASVVILEKMAEGGGNVAVSSGGFVVPLDREAYYTYLKSLYELSLSQWDPELLRVFCDESMKLADYVKSLDAKAKPIVYGHAGYQNLPGAESVQKISIHGVPGKKGGDRLFGVFARAVQSRGIPVLLETPARRLVLEKGVVAGVEALRGGKPYFVRASKAVIIATGGFQCSPQLMQTYIFGQPMSYLGSPGHTGDGLLMAQSVGAQLWHMNAVSAPLGIQVPGVQAGIALITRQPSFIWVDQYGKRFCDEKGLDYHCSWMAVNRFDATQHKYPAIPCYMIMDQRYIDAGPVVSSGGSGYAINREHYVWSKDNSAEIKSGVIIKAETLKELADKIKVPAKTLAATVKRWNTDLTKEGVDTEFGRRISADPNQKSVFVGRDVKAWSAPISETGPYYALRLVPVLYHTMGGPRRSVKSECLDTQGRPIPRLYVAGELGSLWGLTYQGACANSDAMIFGRIAGREAAGLSPRA